MTVETSTGVVPHDHVVQFYANDDDLAPSVAKFLIDGLRAGEVVIVVATPVHMAAFAEAIAASGFNADLSVDRGALRYCDAATTLSSITVGGRLDAVAFAREIGGLVAGALDDGRRVRIYGEMVALLWETGDVSAAIELEQMWNDLRRRLPFSLFCAYHVAHSGAEDHDHSFGRVCDLHSAVLAPPSLHSAAESEGRGGQTVARWEDAHSFPSATTSPSAARRFVETALTAWGCGSLVFDASIVVAELATNAIVHAQSEFVVAVAAVDDTVRIAVRDASTVLPAVQPVDPQATSGRGMQLVSAISQRWGTELLTDGKVVWAELTKP